MFFIYNNSLPFNPIIETEIYLFRGFTVENLNLVSRTSCIVFEK